MFVAVCAACVGGDPGPGAVRGRGRDAARRAPRPAPHLAPRRSQRHAAARRAARRAVPRALRHQDLTPGQTRYLRPTQNTSLLTL